MRILYILLIFILSLTITGCNNKNIESIGSDNIVKEEINEKKIKNIDKIYSQIDKSTDKYELKEYNDIDLYKESNSEKYSSETDEIYNLAIVNLQKLYDKNQLKKIIVQFN
jgi:hypothetical protein